MPATITRPSYRDRAAAPFVQAVIMESQRLGNIVPFAITHGGHRRHHALRLRNQKRCENVFPCAHVTCAGCIVDELRPKCFIRPLSTSTPNPTKQNSAKLVILRKRETISCGRTVHTAGLVMIHSINCAKYNRQLAIVRSPILVNFRCQAFAEPVGHTYGSQVFSRAGKVSSRAVSE